MDLQTCSFLSDNVNVLVFSGDTDNEIEIPKLNRTHSYRPRDLVYQICFKSCKKRFLKRDNCKKTDIKKFCNYAEKREKKNHISWESLKNTTEIWAHKNCKGTFLKTEYLQKQPDVPSTQKGKRKEASNMVGTTPLPTKAFAHHKSARKKVCISIIMERQRCYKMYCML